MTGKPRVCASRMAKENVSGQMEGSTMTSWSLRASAIFLLSKGYKSSSYPKGSLSGSIPGLAEEDLKGSQLPEQMLNSVFLMKRLMTHTKLHMTVVSGVSASI